MQPHLHLSLLGGFTAEIESGGERRSLRGFISVKAQALLAYLACNPRQHTRDALAALLWPAMPDSDARMNLRQALANLKKLCDAWLLIDRDAIGFAGDAPHTLDVTAFESAAQSTRRSELARAAAAYGGPLLRGLTIKDAPEFDQWLTTERERLQQMAGGVLRALARLQQQEDTPTAMSDAVITLQALVALDPLDEPAQRDLMLALARAGQRNAALRQFDLCANTVRRELGVEPEHETAALRERIRATERRYEPPKPEMSLIGREDEVATLLAWLRDDSCRLVTISGMGGIGKTRLALHVASIAGRRMLGGACLVSLDGGTQSDLAHAMLRALTLEPTPYVDAAAQVTGFLRDRELLLVLDNADDIQPAGASWIAALLVAARDVKIVATTRQRFNLRAERRLVLDALPYHGQVSPSARLFLQVAHYASGRQTQLHDAPSAERVRAICARLQGHPLAIVLAASWSHTLSLDEIDAELARGMHRLSSPALDADARHGDLQAVFEQTWRLLSEAERTALARLSVLSGHWTRDAALTVAGASMQTLSALTQCSLIQRAANGEYSQHALLRQFGARHLAAQPGAEQTTRAAHRDYFLAYLAERERALKDYRARDAVRALDACADDITEAWRRASQNMDDAAVAGLANAMEALLVYLETVCRFRLGAQLFGDTADAARRLPGRSEWVASLIVRQSWFLFRLGDYDAGNKLVAEAVHILESLGSRADMGYPLLFMGANHYGAGNLREALRCFEASHDVYAASSDDWGRCGSLNNIGQVLTALGDYARADAVLHEALAIADALATPYQRSHVLHSLAALQQARDDMRGAEAFARDALQAARDNAQSYIVINALQALGAIALRMGRPEDARERFDEAASLANDLGDLQTAARLHAPVR